jgi:tripeptidyl-peptidase I
VSSHNLKDLYNAMDGSYCTFSAFNETGNCNRPECLDPVYPNPAEDGYKGEVMCGVYEPTNIISISYSGAEIDLPYSYIQRQCAEIMKLGLQGVTVVAASGDNGVGSFEGDPTPSGCLGPNEDVFNPEFISDCPYVLAVGATEFVNKRRGERQDGKYNEIATTDFSSGGGFSNVFETPAWQKAHVDKYLAETGPELGFEGYVGGGTNYSNVGVLPGKFNMAGRATPDLAAVGASVRTIYRGRWTRLLGTSASAPIVASFLNLINEERLAVNKSTIGFVHQVIVSTYLIPYPRGEAAGSGL